MFFRGEELDQFLEEDQPYFDLTTHALGIGQQRGKISYVTREDCVACGTEEVALLFERLKIKVGQQIMSGTSVKAGDVLIEGTGSVESLHTVWKVGQNIIDHTSGIATKTRQYRSILQEVGSKAVLLTTRKGFPGTKKLATKAVLAGGAYPHRLGVSETVLIFKQHLNFTSGVDGFIQQLPLLRRELCEKKIIAEVESGEMALQLVKAGVDGIQFDKCSVAVLEEYIPQLRAMDSHLVVLAAGGISEQNLACYGKCDVDGIVTTSLYQALPVDIGVNLVPIPC